MQCPYCHSSYHADCRYGREREDRGFRHEAQAARAEQSDLGLLRARAGRVAPDFTTCDPHRIGGAPLQPSPAGADQWVSVRLDALIVLLNHGWLTGDVLPNDHPLSRAEAAITDSLVSRGICLPRDKYGCLKRKE